MTRDTRKTVCFAVCVAILLVVFGALAWATSGFNNWNVASWFNNWGKGPTVIVPEQLDDSSVEPADDSALVFTPSSGTAIQLRAAAAPQNEAQELSDNSYVLTAVLSPNAGLHLEYEWTIAWASSGLPDWESKTVTDYVGLEVSEDTTIATLTYIQPFGRSLLVTVTTDSFPDLVGTCRVHCKQKATSFKSFLSFDSNTECPRFSGKIGMDSSVPDSDIITITCASASPIAMITADSSTQYLVYCNSSISTYPLYASCSDVTVKTSVALSESFLTRLCASGSGVSNQWNHWLTSSSMAIEGHTGYVIAAEETYSLPTSYNSTYGYRKNVERPNTNRSWLDCFFASAVPGLSEELYGARRIDDFYFYDVFYGLSVFAHDQSIPAEKRYNFIVKQEVIVGDTSFTCERKVFFDYTYPADSLTINPDLVYF